MMYEEGLGELSGMSKPFWEVSDDEEGVILFLKGAEEELRGLAEVVVDIGAGVPGSTAVTVLKADVAVEDISVPEGTKGSALTLRVDAAVAGAGVGGLVEGVKGVGGSEVLFARLKAEGACEVGMAVSIGIDLVRELAVAIEGVLVIGVVV